MKMLRLLICFVAVTTITTAQKKHDHSTTHRAHEHGSAQIDLAVEGKTADIELHLPAMGVVGFEYVAKTAADRKKQADALAKLKGSIGQLVRLEPSAKCTISAKKVEVEQEEPDHAEIDGDFQATCKQPLAGTRVTFGLTKAYPSVSTIKVQIVAEAGSTGAEIKNDQGSVTIPR